MSSADRYVASGSEDVGEEGGQEVSKAGASSAPKRKRSTGVMNKKRRLEEALRNSESLNNNEHEENLNKLRKRNSTAGQHNEKDLDKQVGATPWSLEEEEDDLSLREKVWILFEDPTSSSAANFIAFFLMLLIAISCGAFVIETLPQFYNKQKHIWEGIETVCIAFFTIEYLIRIVTCPDKIKFLSGFLNTVDLIAIVPFYIELVDKTVNPNVEQSGGSTAVFRVLRLIRVFRVFKISRYLKWVKVLGVAMRESASPLAMVLFVIMIATIFFSSAIFFAEQGVWDESLGYFVLDGKESPFQSIPQSMYWCIITMTTVGYGDIYPTTSLGKFFGALTSLSGIFVLAIPITIISTNFNEEYYKMKKKRENMKARMKLLQRHFHQHKTGLAAMNDELEDIIRRTGKEFQKQFEDIMFETNKNLLEEIEMIVKLAYDAKMKKQKRDRDSRVVVKDSQIAPS
eukprot:g1173.t1